MSNPCAVKQAHPEALVIDVLLPDPDPEQALKSSLLQEHLGFHQSMPESHSTGEALATL